MEQTQTNYETARETAARWGVTSRQVRKLAKSGRIAGAVLAANWQGRVWLIPKGARPPEPSR